MGISNMTCYIHQSAAKVRYASFLAVMLSCAVFAARVEVTPVQMPQDVVTEVVATNFAFNVDCDSLRGIELRFLLDGCASNCLQVAFGRDEDGNGVLDVEEMETLYGWRNGRYFAENVRDGIRIEEAAASFQMSRSFAVNLEMKKGVGLYAFSATDETGAAILTNLSATAQNWLYSPDWNMMRVTRRGPGIPAEWFTGDILSRFFYIKFR